MPGERNLKVVKDGDELPQDRSGADVWGDRIDNVAGQALEVAGSAAFWSLQLGAAVVSAAVDRVSRFGKAGGAHELYPSAQPRRSREE